MSSLWVVIICILIIGVVIIDVYFSAQSTLNRFLAQQDLITALTGQARIILIGASIITVAIIIIILGFVLSKRE